MSTINLFNRWQVNKKLFWGIVIGLAIILFILSLLFSAFTRSRLYGIGSTSGANGYLMDSGGGGAFNMSDGDFADNAAEYEFAAEEAGGFDGAAPASPGEFQTASIEPQALSDRKIIKNGDINMSVEDTRQTREDIENLVLTMRDQGAFVVTSVENSGYQNNPYINITIRVPVDQFDRVMDQLADMAVEVTYRNEYSDDVTSQYVDLQNRIESLESARQRLLDIMLEADTTEDLLFAEQQLTQREVELESLKGQLKYLSEAASLSRISINLEPHILSQPVDTSWKPDETIRRAYNELIESLKDFADFMIFFVITFLPWLVFYGLLIYGGVKLYRRRKANNVTDDKKKKK